jgi:hypothetical protein
MRVALLLFSLTFACGGPPQRPELVQHNAPCKEPGRLVDVGEVLSQRGEKSDSRLYSCVCTDEMGCLWTLTAIVK